MIISKESSCYGRIAWCGAPTLAWAGPCVWSVSVMSRSLYSHDPDIRSQPDLSPQDDSSCPECGCPLCPAHLSAHPLHDTECGLLRGLEINTEDMDPVHNIIEVIR